MPGMTRNMLANLIPGLQGAGGQPQQVIQGVQGLTSAIPSGLAAFPKTLRADDFSTSAVAVSATDFTKLGTRTVSAQTIEAFGQSNPSQPQNQGYIRISPVVSTGGATAMTGLVRLFVSNANETNTFVIMENRTDRLSVSSTDKSLLVPLPLTFPAATEDSLLGVSMKADSAATWSPTQSTFVVPITVFQ